MGFLLPAFVLQTLEQKKFPTNLNSIKKEKIHGPTTLANHN